MSYSQFTLKEVKRTFGITQINMELFPNVTPIMPSSWLLETHRRMLDFALFSEKSRSEAIVTPILTELKTLNQNNFAIYSGALMEADKEKGLNGECDFILSFGQQNVELECPIFCLVEAKDDDIETNIGQCLAQMLGARIFNQKDNLPLDKIYGCVTTGEIWQFLKLENDHFYMDSRRYYLDRLENILGVLQAIIDAYKN
jgi:hypothetical protein